MSIKFQSMASQPLEVSIMLGQDDKTRHWLYFRSTPRSEQERLRSIHREDSGGTTVSRKIQVHNGRGQNLTLDETSFELVNCPTKLSTEDFYKIQQDGDEDLQQQYFAEVEAFVKSKVGCDHVICFHTQVRNASKQRDGVQGYAGGIPHTDSSAVSGDEVALQMLESQGDENQYERYLYLNLWRNISDHPIENHHLAMLDERTTVKPDDYISKDLYGEGYTTIQYVLNARHAEQHKWYYFPDMTKSEGILFKQVDSDWTKPGRICFHMSVADPKKQTTTTRPRESMELRMVCYWKKASVNSMPKKEDIRAGKTPSTDARVFVYAASTMDLIAALLSKIPILGSVITAFFGIDIEGSNAPQYSGNPEDYLEQFVNTVGTYPGWPKFAVNWVTGHMKKASSVEKGIASITKELVNDVMGYQKTKSFQPNEKKEIVAMLLGKEEYMSLARKYWGELAE